MYIFIGIVVFKYMAEKLQSHLFCLINNKYAKKKSSFSNVFIINYVPFKFLKYFVNSDENKLQKNRLKKPKI